MTNHWFRFYDEALNDPKVQSLDGDTFKAWVNLLCVASINNGKIGNVSETAFRLRMSEDATLTLFERLLNAGLIDRVSGGVNGYSYAPHGWGKRQYKSDISTERVKRFRKRSSNVPETPPDTDTDTDKKTSKKAFSNLDDLTIETNTQWLEKKRAEGKYLRHDPSHVLEVFKNYCLSQGKAYKDYLAAYRNAFDWERCQPQQQQKREGRENRGTHPNRKTF